MTRWKISLEDWEKANAKGKPPIKPGEIAVLSEKGDGKYKAKRTKIDSVSFASHWEAKRYEQAVQELKYGLIAGFCRQAIFDLSPGVIYRADLIIFHLDGTFEVIERKGYETDAYKVKKRLFDTKFPKLTLKVEKRGE